MWKELTLEEEIDQVRFSLILSRNKKFEHIRKKIQKRIALRFWVRSDVIVSYIGLTPKRVFLFTQSMILLFY